MKILSRIINWVRNLVRRLFKTAQPTLQPRTVAVPQIMQNMQSTNLTANVGGTDYPVYHLHGSPKLAYIFSGNTFVPLSLFKAK
jgi:hypothetical protein